MTSIPAEFLWQSLGPRECKHEKARPSRAVENTYYGKKIVIPSKSYVSKKRKKERKKNPNLQKSVFSQLDGMRAFVLR